MNHDALITTEWLADRLDDATVRVIDCTTHMMAQPIGPSRIVSGRADFDRHHLPGAQHVDMVKDLSDPAGRFPYTAIDSTRFMTLLGRLGISSGDHVVIYGQSGVSTITRAWFIFFLHGQRVSILDGGIKQWQAAGYPVQQGPLDRVPSERASAAAATPCKSGAWLADRDMVKVAMQGQEIQLVNALSAEQFSGSGGAHYGRPGRIPNSFNLPAKELIDSETGCFWDTDTLRDRVAGAGIRLDKPTIHYCGGGIAATTSAFVMHLLGATDWSIYDDSLLDWSNSPDCPMICG